MSNSFEFFLACIGFFGLTCAVIREVFRSSLD